MKNKIGIVLVIMLIIGLLGGCVDSSTTEPEYESYDENYDQSISEIREQDIEYLDEIIDSMEFWETERSTALSNMGYSDEYAALIVTFRESGKSYIYFDVDRDTFDDFFNADSIGRFYNQNIKGKYESEKIEQEIEW